MITLLLGALAMAAPGDLGDNPKNQCSVDDAFPIAGTAGFRNALSALRTNAQTYSAAAFAERNALRRLALRADDGSIVMIEANMNLGVTRAPVFQDDALYGECPAAYVLGTRPVDMYAYNVGGAFRYGRIGGFYSSSVTLGYPGELAYLRAYQTVGSMFVVPMMTLLTPLTGSWQSSLGASAYAQDFVAGLIVDAGIGDLRAGYTQSRGWYVSGNDRYLGLFGSILLRDGLTVVGQFRGGLERAKVPDAVAGTIGRPSLFARSLPLTEAPGAEGEAAPQQVSLLTGHLEQEGLGGVLDVRAAYAVRPVAQLHEASVALHDRAWYAVDDGEDAGKATHTYVEAGFVTLPPQYYYGLAGGTYVHLRAEVQAVIPSGKEGVAPSAVHLTAMFNDPEQTALYPFAVNNVALRMQYKGAF